MIVSCDEMKALEKKAFAAGVTADTLMEQAGARIEEAVSQFFPTPGKCAVYFGKGHNGGDALVAARHLAKRGWEVALHPAFPEEAWSELTTRKHLRFSTASEGKHDTLYFYGRHDARPFLVLDGLLGIGAHGPLRGPIHDAAIEINKLRSTENARVFALDLPTGLDGDTGEASEDCVVADFTLAIGFAKKGLVADHAANFTGRLAVLPLDELSTRQPQGNASGAEVATAKGLAGLLPRRKFDSHKGDYGRIGIVAGSVGMTGAAVMSAEAALRAGGGLITLFVTADIYPILAGTCPPEVMVHPVESYRDVLKANLDVIAIGPGLGKRDADDILRIIETSALPMVVDADALNLVSTDVSLLGRCAGKRLLTPHPGEMSRLFETKNLTRREIAETFTRQYPVTLLLKGSLTIVAEAGLPFSYNTTGSPGMATGGMGDTLTGTCAALIGQGLSCYDAARLGAWVCGRAAEIAIHDRSLSEESLAATDLPPAFGKAFEHLRGGCV